MKQLTSKPVRSFRSRCVAAIFALGLFASLVPFNVPTAAAASSPGARVSFTFDDGLASAITDAAPTLAKYGFVGTNYVISKCIGMTAVPNTCAADSMKPYMTWDQVKTLQNTYGWEIGAHTATHPYLASSDPATQPNVLTQAQVASELTQNKADLAAQGITATDFASPYGDWNPSVLTQIAKQFGSHRGFADVGYNTFPGNDYLIYDQQVQAGVSVATVKSYIDAARANNQWLVLTFHNIKPVASTNPDDYEYNTGDLDQIAAYVKSLNMPVVKVSEGVTTNAGNLFANGSFDTAISSDINNTAVWSTDDPTNIKQNTGNNGAFPSPANSVELNGTTKNIELFSPRVAVDGTKTYVVKSFLNVASISVATGHEVAFYIDEYDANGTFLSTQYKKSEPSVWVENLNFEYKPTSTNVKSARLQIVATASSAVKAYIDNVQMFAEDGSTNGGTGSVGKAGDVNGDNAINALDLSILLSNWNKAGARAQGDLSGDGTVNALDLSILLSNWGK